MTDGQSGAMRISDRDHEVGWNPPYLHTDYASTRLRSPLKPLVRIEPTLSERTGPVVTPASIDPADADLTRQHPGEPLGERIIVSGTVSDVEGRTLPGQLIEVWQANAAGRYAHDADHHLAPMDPNFTGTGRCVTDAQGRYRFVTIKPGAYPWRNHVNAWRPSHIHFSVLGEAFVSRLVTQMYFPGDPLLSLDPIVNALDAAAATRLVCRFDIERTVSEWALGYRFDIVLRGPDATPPAP